MNSVLSLYKKIGETPLACIERFKRENPEYERVPMTYAGRLDPIAEGVLIVLAGDAVHEKEKYLALDKKYIAEVLWGFATDTYDILGVAEKAGAERSPFPKDVGGYISSLVGKHRQEYPPYSSKTVAGKPLWQIAREGGGGEERPSREIEIYEVSLLEHTEIRREAALSRIESTVGAVKGDFRQEEIMERWISLISDTSHPFAVSRLSFRVSSGTYIRSLVHEMGRHFGTGATLFALKRTAVGGITVDKSLA